MGRGFSVHSPFAYHFIRMVLRCPYPYYDFDSEVDGAVWQALYRVACHFNPSRVCVLDGPWTEEARRVLSLALPSAQVVSTPLEAQLTVSTTDCMKGECPVYFFVNSDPRRLLAVDAMVFASRQYAVAIDFPGLPHQFFPVL